MVRRLILLRHGDAAWPSDHSSDHDRPLTATGVTQASRMVELIGQRQWVPDAIVTSTAARATSTAAAFTQICDVAVSHLPLLYSAGLREIQEGLGKVSEATKTLLVVGHNPSLSALASVLSAVSVSLGTANAALLEIEAKGWSEALAEDAGWSLALHLQPH